MNDIDPVEGFVMAESVKPVLERLTIMANFTDGPITFEREQLLSIKRLLDRQATAYDRLAILAKSQGELIENLTTVEDLRSKMRREFLKAVLGIVGIIAVLVLTNVILG